MDWYQKDYDVGYMKVFKKDIGLVIRMANWSENITLNLIEGKIQLGQWQRIMLVELDKARPRKIQVQIIGE